MTEIRWSIRLICVSLLVIANVCIGGESPEVRLLKNEAKKYYWGIGAEQDYKKALSLYEQAAALGDSEASYIAGGMYYTGKGVVKNPFKAFQYLDFAARQGKTSPESQRALAQFYLIGDVVPQNYHKAAQWYQSAAESGDKDAQVELGFLFFSGRGVAQDQERAFQLFEKAAYQNSSVAQYNLGIMWYTGVGVPEHDLVQAYAWFSVAASNGFASGRAARDFLVTVLSEEQLARGQQQGTLFYQSIRGSKPVR